ncbi:Disease resistance protein RPS6 [Raphanus sativus]|nr:Disease resistance protein RPS6 [Raphanus sativus]
MSFCSSLETIPTGINLKSLHNVNLDGCILLKSFPDISTNISELHLNQTGIEEVPSWIENFSRLGWLYMYGCNSLQRVSLNMTKLKHLHKAEFSDCAALTDGSWNDSSSEVAAMSTDDIQPKFLEDEPSCPPEGYFSMLNLSFINCDNFDPEAMIKQQSALMEMIILGEEVPSYFTHRTTGTSLTNIPLPRISPSQPLFSFRCCAVVDAAGPLSFEIETCFRFVDILGNHVESVDLVRDFSTTKMGSYLVIFDSYFPLMLEEIAALADQLKGGSMDIQFRLVKEDSQLQLKGFGIQFPDRDHSIPGW